MGKCFTCLGLSGSTDEELATSLSTALSAAADTAVVVPFGRHGDELTVNVGKAQSSTSFRRMAPGESLGWSDSRVALEVAIEQEEVVSQDDMLSEGDRLIQRLHGFGLRLDKQLGDGNCQFRSLACALYGTAERHMRVRRRACAHIAGEGRRRFEAYLGPGGIDEYVARMSCDGTWGDELTLRAIAEEFSLVVSVITSSTYNFYLRYVPDRIRRPNAEVFLAYTSPCHYDRIVRGNGP
jgi:hypothetical protein